VLRKIECGELTCSRTKSLCRDGQIATACFWKSNFQGDWTVLNDSTLILHAPLPKDLYIIKLFEPVPRLQTANQLAPPKN
jgi:hypothetical protein